MRRILEEIPQLEEGHIALITQQADVKNGDPANIRVRQIRRYIGINIAVISLDEGIFHVRKGHDGFCVAKLSNLAFGKVEIPLDGGVVFTPVGPDGAGGAGNDAVRPLSWAARGDWAELNRN